ncbi:MFS transporter [Inhella proteolytica]|uniref:MFS transporter n=1 Tax=Inhella proteolytica TaxID=2795029 RepID=A0A931J137_9BURK|nr:MFS transporter [Inhella proteolytica]MBH9576416.1 MFS transporter [Inhella proteolytica]
MPSWLRHAAVAALVCALGLALCGWLSLLKLERALEAAAQARMGVPAAALREGLQATLALGLPLESAAAVPDLLVRERRADAAITALHVLDAGGRVLFSTEAARLGQAWQAGAAAVRAETLRTAFDLPVGQVLVVYGLAAERQALAGLRAQLLQVGLLATLVGTLLSLVFSWLPRLQSWAVPAGLLAALLLAYGLNQRAVQATLMPALERKAEVVGASVAQLVGKALQHGMALPELVGVEDYLAAQREQHPELAWLGLRDAQGVLRFESGSAVAQPAQVVGIEAGGQRLGQVEVHVSPEPLQRTLRELLLDLAVVAVVAAFVVRELQRAALARQAVGDGQVLARLRLPLLLFMLAEEFTRAFLPGFARSLGEGGSHWVAGLPIVVFMLMVALGQPGLGRWSERLGRRRALASGAALGALALLGAALAPSTAALLLWRALGGLAFALVFVAGQGLVVAHSSAPERTRAFAGFVSAIMVAGVCGPPLGGLAADYLGPRGAFALAALWALLAWVACLGLPREPGQAPAGAPLSLGDLGRLLRQPGFRGISLAAALPAKLLLAGGCFYLVPLLLAARGETAAAAGRAQMLYALCLLATLPLGTRAAERGWPLGRLVGLGLLLSTVGALALLAGGGLWPVMAAMAVLGAGQGVSIAAQSSWLAQLCAAELQAHGPGAVYGFYRLLERLGNALGPLAAAALVGPWGLGGAYLGLAALVLLAGAWVLARAGRWERA